mgnify:CR=1 FL=1
MNLQDVLKKIIIVMAIFLILPVTVKAHTFDSNNTKKFEVTTIKRFDNTTSSEDKCKESVLGDVNDEDSVAWLLQKILNYIKILGPSLAVIYSALDFTKAIVSSNSDSMKKTQQKLINRIIAVALLFLIPTLTEVVLEMVGITCSTAGLK